MKDLIGAIAFAQRMIFITGMATFVIGDICGYIAGYAAGQHAAAGMHVVCVIVGQAANCQWAR